MRERVSYLLFGIYGKTRKGNFDSRIAPAAYDIAGAFVVRAEEFLKKISDGLVAVFLSDFTERADFSTEFFRGGPIEVLENPARGLIGEADEQNRRLAKVFNGMIHCPRPEFIGIIVRCGFTGVNAADARRGGKGSQHD